MNGIVNVVATVAFGMGINNKHVRLVTLWLSQKLRFILSRNRKSWKRW